MFPRDAREPAFIAWLRNARVRRTVILLTLWAFIAVVLFSFHFVLLPFGLAVLLAFILEPIVERLAVIQIGERTIPRPVAVIGTYVVLAIVLGVFGTWAVAQIGRELSKVGMVTATLLGNMEQLIPRLMDRLASFAEANHLPIERDEIEAFIRQNVELLRVELSKNAATLLSLGRDVVSGVVRAIFGLFLVLMLTAFITIDRKRIQKFFFSLVPPEYQPAYRAVMSGIGVGLAGVVRGQVLICLTNGVLTFIGLWLLGVKLPLILASVASTLSLIPIFGSILSSIPIVAMGLTDSFAKGLLALLWIIVIHLVEANFLNPKIMGDAAKIHPVVVVFALIAGEKTSGLIGALFAVPVASVLLTIFKFLHRRALGVTIDPSVTVSTADLAQPEGAPPLVPIYDETGDVIGAEPPLSSDLGPPMKPPTES